MIHGRLAIHLEVDVGARTHQALDVLELLRLISLCNLDELSLCVLPCLF